MVRHDYVSAHCQHECLLPSRRQHPFGAVLIPLAILRVVLLPSARAAAASIALFVGVIIQAAIMVPPLPGSSVR